MTHDTADCRITYIGGPTALIEVGGLRLLTDPTFDPAGGRYSFGWGTGSRKTAGPAIAARDVGRIDAVLLSHDHHDDNLDRAGRELLATAGTVLTTEAGARRLGGGARGLAPWDAHVLAGDGHPEVTVTATPARHGPPLSRPIVGHVTGFMLEWDGQRHGAFWISGDTVWFSGVEEVARRYDVGTALLHLGGVRFPVSGPVRYTMNAAEGVRVARAMSPHSVIPIHYEQWRHFRQGRPAIEREFGAAGLAGRLRWLNAGMAVGIEV